MKQTSRISIVFLILIISFSACKEDIYMDWKIKNELWLENNKNQSGVITTASGLQYKVLWQGHEHNRKLNKNSTIYVKYKGALIDGSVFEEQTTAVELSLSSAIAGWREGVPKLYDGGWCILYVPSPLGYDTTSTKSNIPPYSTLIFEIYLE